MNMTDGSLEHFISFSSGVLLDMGFYTPERDPKADAAKSSPARLVGSIAALAALCAKKACMVTRKLRRKPRLPPPEQPSPSPSPRSPLARPRHVLKTISQSAMTLVQKKRKRRGDGETKGKEEEEEEEEEEVEWGDGGVWQRAILMGDKCQPLNFSGAIYYDNNGKKMDELPLRSPRASPLPGYLLRKSET